MPEKSKTESLELVGAVGPGGFDSIDVVFALADLPDPLNVHLASGGGDTNIGLAVAAQLAGRNTTITAAFAGSVATVILAAGKRRILAADGWLYFHRSWACVSGQAPDFEAHARYHRELDALIADRVARYAVVDPEVVLHLMDREARLTPGEALELGLVHEIGEPSGNAPEQPSSSPPAAVREIERASHAAFQMRMATDVDVAAFSGHAGAEVAKIDAAFAALEARKPPLRMENAAGRERMKTVWHEYIGESIRRAHAVRDNRPVPEPRAGAWRCGACRRTNHHSPGTDAGRTACAWCGATDHESPTTNEE